MNSFWDLTRFEFRKIFRKKSTVIILLITVLISIFSCGAVLLGDIYENGKPVESQIEAMNKDRSYARALDSRMIDETILLEMSMAYGKIPVNEGYRQTSEYQQYARPYASIYALARQVYGASEPFNVDNAKILTSQKAKTFYDIRNEIVKTDIQEMNASDATKQKLLELNSQVDTPFEFSYSDGYTRFFTMMYTTGMLVCFVAAILLAPLFAGEYSSGTDQVILTSKHGKGKLILAKLFVGVITALGLSLIFSMLTYFQCMLTYGFDGANAAIQLFRPLDVYPLTMSQLALLCIICVMSGTLLTCAINMLLSAKLKSAFSVIILIGILMIVPMFINDPGISVLLSNLMNLLPTNMMALWTQLDAQLFELGNLSIEPYVLIPIFSLVFSIILSIFAYFGFKKHQIS